ncbi:MAG TPA: hypothetical protein DEP45_03020 [Armatimonadetes bacterium]|nr:hypothetical protein [Armatimonadota bacterium]
MGGVKITETEFSDRLVKAFGEDMLRSMIDRELIRQAAADRGVEVSEEELAKEMEQAKAQYGTEEQFQQFLTANDLTQEEWEEEVSMMVLARKLALHGVEPTEQQLKEFFEQNKDQFAKPAMVSFSEIVVDSKATADEVVAELKKGESSFADLASRYSMATTREAGGERPEMPIQSITQPQVREVAENLPVGQVSDPIDANGSFVILTVRDRSEGRPASFETDREAIEEQYKMANANSLRDILDEQLKKTRVTIVDPRFSSLNEAYTTVPEDVPQFGAEGQEPLPQDGARQAPAAPTNAAPAEAPATE